MSFVENILARAEETIPVVRPRPRSRFEEQSPTDADTFDAAPSEEAIAARPPAVRPGDAIHAPDARPRRSAAEREPDEPATQNRASTMPTAADAPAAPSRVTSIERLERVVETRLPPVPAEASTPGNRGTSPHADLFRETPADGAAIPTGPNERPQPPPAAAPAPMTVESRIETVLRTVRTEAERERIVERAAPGSRSAPGQPAQSSSTAVANTTPAWTEPGHEPARTNTRTPTVAVTAAIAPAAPSIAPSPAPAGETVAPAGHERVLHVSIGQLEIRATRRGVLDRQRGTEGPRTPAAPRLTLEEYLRERNGGAS